LEGYEQKLNAPVSVYCATTTPRVHEININKSIHNFVCN